MEVVLEPNRFLIAAASESGLAVPHRNCVADSEDSSQQVPLPRVLLDYPEAEFLAIFDTHLESIFSTVLEA
jgi:hypothetical protein